MSATHVKRPNVAYTYRFDAFGRALEQAVLKKKSLRVLKKMCVKESLALRQHLNTLSSVKRYYTYYRNVCRRILKPRELATCLAVFRLTDGESKSLDHAYAKQVAEEHRNLRPLKDVDLMIAKAVALLQAPSLYDRLLGLACVTGRRVAELACTASFEPHKEHWMFFDGQLKEKTRVVPRYSIPVLACPLEIVKTRRSLREHRPQWQGQTIKFHDCASRELSRRVKVYFSPYIENPTVKDLRSAYAEICYARFGAAHLAKSRFFSDILGHGFEDNTTGQSYLDFYIVSEEERKTFKSPFLHGN